MCVNIIKLNMVETSIRKRKSYRKRYILTVAVAYVGPDPSMKIRPFSKA